MKGIKINLRFFIILFALSIHANAHSEERKHIYPCGNKFYHYYLDNEPAEYGVNGGDYEKEKAAYVGIVDAGDILMSGRVQLSPPGIYFGHDSKATFENDSSKIWYLYSNHHHKYKWIDSKDGEDVSFAVDFGSEGFGSKLLIGRVKYADDTVALGLVSAITGRMYYINKKGVEITTSTGYQVLTCKSRKRDKMIPMPKLKLSAPPPETGCLNNWIEYKGDDAPSKNGISAGTYDCGNIAYVGKGEQNNYMLPGRIQTTQTMAGLYFIANGKEVYRQNGSYYLADNPNYTYYWVSFNGHLPENAVYTRSSNPYIFAIPRAKINGHMQIGQVVAQVANFPGDDLTAVRYTNYELLVCDPWPKYQCTQEWKKFTGINTPSVDGFSIGTYKDDIISYIGRSTSKQINGCDYELGRIQTTPASGAYYLDDLTATEKFDNSNAEYLVKNQKYFYKWIASRSGIKVANALKIHKEGHRPFYIGVTQINDNVFVGKVRSGEGLYFVDINGKQMSTSSYNVLTCTSSEAVNDVYSEESNESWFDPFGCPVRKIWNFKCLCRNEFKGFLTSNSAKWNEDTCSYDI